jgi:hypothetical protein
LLIAFAYTSAIFQGNEIRKMQVKKYISRRKNKINKYRIRRTFGIGLDGEKWVNYFEQYFEIVQELMNLTRNKRRFYQRGIRAATLIQSTL